MIRIITTEQTVIIAVEQVKSLFYDKKENKVLVIYNDNTQLDCEEVLKVSFNNEDL